MPELALLRQGTAADAVNGVLPVQVAEPETPEAFAEALALASRDKLQTVIRGGGTKLGWGRTPQAVDLLVSTARLNRLIAHRHGDLTVTAQAGHTPAELNAALAKHGQWLPLDSVFPQATLGGLVATNDSGPSRYRNGTPRDLVIGITLALTDGRLVKAGGTVVKNVAGYDLGKLVSGSHGTLAGIADITFKLVPIPHASSTIVSSYTDRLALSRDVAALTASQVEPAAFDVRGPFGGDPSYAVLVRFASSPAATDAQVAAAKALLAGKSSVITGAAEADAWTTHTASVWAEGGAVVRLSWLPTKLPQVFELATSLGATFIGRATGSGFMRIDGDIDAKAAAIQHLRNSVDVGNVVVLRARQEVKERIDVWGPPGDSAPVMAALKKMFDPAGTLNAGRGPV